MPKKKNLQDEWRKNWRLGKRREVGRTPNWVFQKIKEKPVKGA